MGLANLWRQLLRERQEQHPTRISCPLPAFMSITSAPTGQLEERAVVGTLKAVCRADRVGQSPRIASWTFAMRRRRTTPSGIGWSSSVATMRSITQVLVVTRTTPGLLTFHLDSR